MSKNADTGRLQLVDLVKVFGQDDHAVRAVDDIELDIAPGEFITLLGPSGCGKTTTLRMIAGFEDASSGLVLLDGENMVSTPPNKRPMAMVFQSYALFPHLTVYDNVAYGLRLRKISKIQLEEEVDLALTTMNLTTMAKRVPSQLSGGQQQRVALARAMVMKPKVLLFDEPLSNLDAKLRVKMRLEIRRLQRRLGITSVYVTHDQSEAMSMSDRIVVMNQGKIEQADTPEMIYRCPASVFVADFIGRANFLQANIVPPVQSAVGIAETSTPASSLRVKVLGKEVTVPAHPAASQASNVVLLVRPESFRLTRLSGEQGTQAEVVGDRGRVLAAVFYGENVEYEIETEFGNVVCIESDPQAGDMLDEGDTVRLDFVPKRAWLLPES